jgi:Uncharacterised protein family (UPF0014)
MMTGAILGGSSVDQAAKLQMVIMFMIAASTALASIVTTVLALGMVVDADHRVRSDRVDVREHAIYRARNWMIGKMVEGFWVSMRPLLRCFKRMKGKHSDEANSEETERLLG